MLSQDIAEALKNHLDREFPTLNVYEAGEDSTITRPALVVSVEDIHRHEILRGTYQVEVAAAITTQMEDTTLADHKALGNRLECIMADEDMLPAALKDATDQVHYLEDRPPFTQFDSSLRVTICRASIMAEARRERSPSSPSGLDLLVAGDYLVP